MVVTGVVARCRGGIWRRGRIHTRQRHHQTPVADQWTANQNNVLPGHRLSRHDGDVLRTV